MCRLEVIMITRTCRSASVAGGAHPTTGFRSRQGRRCRAPSRASNRPRSSPSRGHRLQRSKAGGRGDRRRQAQASRMAIPPRTHRTRPSRRNDEAKRRLTICVMSDFIRTIGASDSIGKATCCMTEWFPFPRSFARMSRRSSHWRQRIAARGRVWRPRTPIAIWSSGMRMTKKWVSALSPVSR